ncbi:hypothetical protein N1851_003890 [Merluccius polli]|uniref:Uncharacterized protein n=1 Tax=Merluccius polli TaxID=89951 RepID=A0AA47P7J0_MERPO|nr:hypothetical protein N1851_003890 [Merluccius polli]
MAWEKLEKAVLVGVGAATEKGLCETAGQEEDVMGLIVHKRRPQKGARGADFPEEMVFEQSMVEPTIMYCFSCWLFLSEEKFKSKTAWKMVGISRWKHAIGKNQRTFWHRDPHDQHGTGQAFRGDDERTSSENQGNILELMKLFAQYDSIMNLHLDAFSKMKTSKKRLKTQNNIITALGTYFRREIQKEIKDAEIYSIMLMEDETTDVSHKEQVSFVV